MLSLEKFLELYIQPQPKNLNISGIYAIYNTISKKIYIGSSKNIRKRWKYHRWGLLHKRHPNPHLSRAYELYGKQVFSYLLLEKVEENNLINKERDFISLLDSKVLYNLSPILDKRVGVTPATQAAADKRRGISRSEETKKRISKSVQEKWASDEDYRNRCSANKKGIIPSKETREKMSLSRKIRAAQVSPEEKLRWNNQLKEAAQKRRKINEETASVIKTLLLEKISMREISKRLGVSPHIVAGIKKGPSWKEVSPKELDLELKTWLQIQKNLKTQKEKRLSQILEMLKEGKTYKEIGNKFRVSETLIWKIRKEHFPTEKRQEERKAKN